MQIFYSRPPKPLHLSAQYRYPQVQLLEIMEKLHAQGHDIWLTVKHNNEYMQLTAQEFSVVAHIISADHDMIVGENIPYDDGWNQETKAMEESAQQHMEEETSDEEIETEDAIVC